MEWIFNISKYENIHIHLFFAILIIFISPTIFADVFPEIAILTKNNQQVILFPEPLDTFAETPIRNTRDRINKKFSNPRFFSLYMLNLNHVNDSDLVQFELKNGDLALRINFFSIDKKTEKADRIIKYFGSLHLKPHEILHDAVPFYHQYENMNFILAEYVKGENQISEGLKNLRLLKDKKPRHNIEFGTNWSMSQLELEVDIKADSQKNTVQQITFDEIIDLFIDPKWVIAIRTSQID